MGRNGDDGGVDDDGEISCELLASGYELCPRLIVMYEHLIQLRKGIYCKIVFECKLEAHSS